MTTSGTSSFNYTRDQIIASAARKLGAIAAGEALGSGANQDFADQLNIMVKNWDATGIHIWTEEEATLFVQPNQIAYTLGGSTTDNIAWVQASNPASAFTSTTLASSAATGATNISLTSATGFAASQFVGVALDSGTIQWTTETGAPTGTTVTLAAGLTSSAAAGNSVYTYTTKVQRPLRVVSARNLLFQGSIETPMILLSRLDYRALPNKNSPGISTQLYYDPRGGANNQGIMYLWPAPQDILRAINFTWWRPIQDFNNPGDNPDLPNEWLNAIILNLAFQMAAEYDCAPQRYAIIKEQAQGALDLAMGFDREPESYFFGFNTDQTGP